MNFSNKMEAEVTEESQKLAANHRAKEDMQKSISQIKTSVSEKSARLVSKAMYSLRTAWNKVSKGNRKYFFFTTVKYQSG